MKSYYFPATMSVGSFFLRHCERIHETGGGQDASSVETTVPAIVNLVHLSRIGQIEDRAKSLSMKAEASDVETWFLGH